MPTANDQCEHFRSKVRELHVDNRAALPTNAHVEVQSLQGPSKGSVETQNKVTGAEELKFKVFLLLRQEMRSVFQGLPQTASKIIQTTRETTT